MAGWFDERGNGWIDWVNGSKVNGWMDEFD